MSFPNLARQERGTAASSESVKMVDSTILVVTDMA